MTVTKRPAGYYDSAQLFRLRDSTFFILSLRSLTYSNFPVGTFA